MDSEGLNGGLAIKTENKGKGQAVGREVWEIFQVEEAKWSLWAKKELGIFQEWKEN